MPLRGARGRRGPGGRGGGQAAARAPPRRPRGLHARLRPPAVGAPGGLRRARARGGRARADALPRGGAGAAGARRPARRAAGAAPSGASASRARRRSPAPPRRRGGGDDRAVRVVRCCLFDAGAGADGVRSNVHEVPATGDGAAWAFAPRRAAAAGGAPRLRARLDAYDSAEFLVAADDETAQLSLLFELATTVPRAYFDGRAAEAEDDEKKQRRAAAEALGSDYESASDSDYGMDDASAAADSGSDDDDDADGGSGGDSRRRRRNANKGDGDDSDRVYSDSDSDASRRRSTTKKKPRGKPRKSRRPAKAGRRPAWFRGRAAGRAAAAKPRDPSPAADHDARPRAGGAVEVTCGWGVVSLAELRASSTVTVPLKGGAPWGETEFGADGAAPSSLWRTLTGSAGAPRLTLRVAGGAAAGGAARLPRAGAARAAAERVPRVPGRVPAAPRRGVVDARRRPRPRRLPPHPVARRGPPRAPRALDRPRRGARAAKPRPARGRGKRSAPGGRLRALARVRGAPRRRAGRRGRRPRRPRRRRGAADACRAAVAPAGAVEQAVALLGEVLDDDEGDGRSPRAGRGLFAPFRAPARAPRDEPPPLAGATTPGKVIHSASSPTSGGT